MDRLGVTTDQIEKDCPRWNASPIRDTYRYVRGFGRYRHPGYSNKTNFGLLKETHTMALISFAVLLSYFEPCVKCRLLSQVYICVCACYMIHSNTV